MVKAQLQSMRYKIICPILRLKLLHASFFHTSLCFNTAILHNDLSSCNIKSLYAMFYISYLWLTHTHTKGKAGITSASNLLLYVKVFKEPILKVSSELIFLFIV